MKAKFYIGIIIAVLLPGLMTQAQIADSGDYYRNDDEGTIVNNYYDYDYYYSSRINRFHRSFSTFDYYAPLFTDSYWYNYEPYSWGLSIYGGRNPGFGFSFSSPAYYDWGWNNSYLGGSYYWGYDPFYFSNWFSPFIINIGTGNRYHNNYFSWQGRNRPDYNFRHDYNSYHNYSSDRYQANNRSPKSDYIRRSEPVNNNSRVNNTSRRVGSNYTQTVINREDKNRSGNGSYNNINNSETRRAANPSTNRNNVNNNSNRNTKQSIIYPSNIQTDRRSEKQPFRSQGYVANRSVQSDRSRNVNTRTEKYVNRSESASTPARRSTVSPGNNSRSGRSVITPSRSSSSSARSVSSSSSGKSSSSKSGRNSSRRSSSSAKSKKK